MQFNTAGTTSGTPALVIDSWYIASTNGTKGTASMTVPFKYPITLDVAWAARVLGRLTILVTGIGGSSATRCSVNWKELR
jgi:hypothetical protein